MASALLGWPQHPRHRPVDQTWRCLIEADHTPISAGYNHFLLVFQVTLQGCLGHSRSWHTPPGWLRWRKPPTIASLDDIGGEISGDVSRADSHHVNTGVPQFD